MATAAQHILRVLEEAGVQHVFGVPGGGTVTIFTEMYDHRGKIHPILVRHEQVAASMADAYARASGRPAVIMGQGAFIASYASAGLMEALMSSSPIIAMTETSDFNMGPRPVQQCGTGEHGSVDFLGVFRAITKYTTLATTPKEAVIGAQLAIKQAVTGNPGPTCLLMRNAAINGEVDEETAPFLHHTSGYLVNPAAKANPEDVARAIDLLAGAKSPVIIAGKGVHNARAHAELKGLAEAWAIPVATSYKGKSAIEETHPLALGMMGTYGRRLANAIVGEADLVLVVGAKLTSTDTANESPKLLDPRRQKFIQIDIDARNAGWAFPVDVSLIGDAKAVLGQMLQASDRNAAARAAKSRQRVQELQSRKQQAGFFADPEAMRDSAPVMPQRLARLLQENLDPRTNITLDAGFNRLWMALFYQAQRSDTFFCPGGVAAMGWAPAAALGVKLARPNDPVVAVAGDGGFMMSVQALSTALEYDLPFVCVVVNDSALGMVRHYQVRRGRRVVASEFAPTDYAAIARGFGAQAFRIEDSRDLPAAIKTAQSAKVPSVIDVIINRDASPY